MSETLDSGWIAHPQPTSAFVSSDNENLRDLEEVTKEFARRQLPGPGWSGILQALHDGLHPLDPDYRFAQVKEKAGILRLYGEFESSVSEECGRPGPSER